MSLVGFYEELSEDILHESDFIKDYETLALPDTQIDTQHMSTERVKRLLESSAIFACSRNEDHRNIALRISSCFIQDSWQSEAVVAASELVLLRLGNFPMLEKAIGKNGAPDFFNITRGKLTVAPTKLTSSLFFEVSRKERENEVTIADRPSYLTDFQSQVYGMLSDRENVSISAPTSSGKSFVLRRYIVNEIASKTHLRVVYIVPTRALIAEVQRKLRGLLLEHAVKDIPVITTSWEVVGRQLPNRVVLVLTPERLQTIQGNSESAFKVDLLVVDEAQKIEDSQRGIVLEDTVQSAIDSNRSLQVVFISPYVENPEKLNEVFLRGRTKEAIPIKSNSSPVTQTLYLVEWNGRKLELDVLLPEIGGLRRSLKKTETDVSRPSSQSELKAWFAHNMVKTKPTMIYCNAPEDCRTTARAISEMIGGYKENPDIDEAVRYLKKHIHPSYYLSDFLKKGIGYHYGPMPPSVRLLVESLFSTLKLQYLCCTSTLAEGVNLPAKNVVVYKPRSGRIRKMKGITFWNLVGRAGRLGKDFSGSIYCINTGEWEREVQPDVGGRDHEITSSMEEVIRTKKDQIVSYLREELRAARSDDVATAVIRFLINEIRGENQEFVGDLLTRNEEIKREDLLNIVQMARTIKESIRVPAELVYKNSSMDPRLLNALYLSIQKDKKAPVPVHPSNPHFRERLCDIIVYVDSFFNRGYTPSASYYAFLGSMWAEEKPLGEIIAKRLEYLRNTGKIEGSQAEVNREIEEIIKFINDKLTYHICRDVKCYVDVLRTVCQEQEREAIPSEKLGYYLELGAHTPTTLTLIENGVPRTEAILASRRIRSKDIQSYDECLREIERISKELKSELPSAIFREAFKPQEERP